MTFSILAKDAETGVLAGAAATGSLCVGAWVLRGDPRVGLSASQGAAPSTLWGDRVLGELRAGTEVEAAVRKVTLADRGRAFRQLTALDVDGSGAAFTGARNSPEMGSRVFEGGVAAGNLLQSEAVLDAMVAGFLSSDSSAPGERLLAALGAAQRAGGDARGLFSAALLVLSPDQAPLDLRIDYHKDPLASLGALHQRATTGDYDRWTRQVPTINDPERVLDGPGSG